jgi:hypothetical protein
LFTTSYYFSKNNLNKHALVQLSKVPIEYFNYVYVRTLLKPSSYTTNITNTACTIYIKGVQAVYNTELIKLRINLSNIDITNPELRDALQTALG